MEHLIKMGYDKVHTIGKCIFVASTTLSTRSNMSQISSYTLQYSKKQTIKQIKKKTKTSLNKLKNLFLQNQTCRGRKVAM